MHYHFLYCSPFVLTWSWQFTKRWNISVSKFQFIMDIWFLVMSIKPSIHTQTSFERMFMLPQMIAAHLFHERHVHLSRQQGMGTGCSALTSTLLTWDYQIHVPCIWKECGTSSNTLVASESYSCGNYIPREVLLWFWAVPLFSPSSSAALIYE